MYFICVSFKEYALLVWINLTIQAEVTVSYLQYKSGKLKTYSFGIVNIISDFGSNRFRKYGKCCPLWTTNPQIGNGCDAVTH